MHSLYKTILTLRPVNTMEFGGGGISDYLVTTRNARHSFCRYMLTHGQFHKIRGSASTVANTTLVNYDDSMAHNGAFEL